MLGHQPHEGRHVVGGRRTRRLAKCIDQLPGRGVDLMVGDRFDARSVPQYLVMPLRRFVTALSRLGLSRQLHF